MPLYFFDTCDGAGKPDVESWELPDLDSARHEAIRLTSELLNVAPDKASLFRMNVSDPDGAVLFTISVQVTEVITPREPRVILPEWAR